MRLTPTDTPASCEPPNGDRDLCTPEYPCGTGEGDCDTTADCDSQFTFCAHDVGANYGLAWWVDVCEINWAVPIGK